MLIFIRKTYRAVFLFLCLFWTTSTLAQNADPSPEEPKDFQEESEISPSAPIQTEGGFLGFKKKHSLVYVGVGLNQSSASLSGSPQGIEVGYEKAQRPDMKWGFYLEYLNGDRNEQFLFPNTGYSEKRTNHVSVYTLGIQARHKLLRYLDLRGALGVSITSMEVIAAETDAPAPSTAPGHKESYPLSMNAKIALQLSKHYQKYGLALELVHEQTALGMNHNISANSLNLLFRYFYNR